MIKTRKFQEFVKELNLPVKTSSEIEYDREFN